FYWAKNYVSPTMGFNPMTVNGPSAFSDYQFRTSPIPVRCYTFVSDDILTIGFLKIQITAVRGVAIWIPPHFLQCSIHYYDLWRLLQQGMFRLIYTRFHRLPMF